MEVSRKKRAYRARLCESTSTKQESVREALPTCTLPKWPQSTWACSPGSVLSRR